METLVAVAQHRNQYYGRDRSHGSGRYGLFGSPPSKKMQGINCRSFQSGAGLLPTPLRSKSCTAAVRNQAFSGSDSPKTPSPSINLRSDERMNGKNSTKSSAILIPFKTKQDIGSNKEGSFVGEYHFSELWAGPAYSNSPPPSSLPIPKFSLKPKRTVSLELPSSSPIIDLDPIAKSAPASPTRQFSLSPRDLFADTVSSTNTCGRGRGRGRSMPSEDIFDDADCATKTLRRILNLDLADD